MINFLLEKTGKHKAAATLILIGLFGVPLSLRMTIDAFSPVFKDKAVFRAELFEEVHAAEKRSKEYANGKHNDVLIHLIDIKKNLVILTKRFDRLIETKGSK